jgi:methylthioribose-1-phosphate isomerase
MNTLEFRDGALYLLDQTKLPLETVLLECREVEQVAEAIVNLSVRARPPLVLQQRMAWSWPPCAAMKPGRSERVLRGTGHRPCTTSVDPSHRRESVLGAAAHAASYQPYRQAGARVPAPTLQAEADVMLAEDVAANRAMGLHGADLIPDGAQVLTHCNTGALATAAFGTALG